MRKVSVSAVFAILFAAVSVASAQHGDPASGASKTIRIMPLGDSITYGTPNPRYGGYRHLLGTLLTKDGYSFQFVGSQQSGEGIVPSSDNEGHPGWTIARIKKGIDSQGWLETYRPDIILLHIGTNDLRPLIGQAESAPAHLSALLDEILARLPHARVIVAQIIPNRPGPDDVHRAYNAAIPGIAASKGPRVSLVDMQDLLSPEDFAQGLHPNKSGYDKMARAWERALRLVIADLQKKEVTSTRNVPPSIWKFRPTPRFAEGFFISAATHTSVHAKLIPRSQTLSECRWELHGHCDQKVNRGRGRANPSGRCVRPRPILGDAKSSHRRSPCPR